jgi:hypothetical protein
LIVLQVTSIMYTLDLVLEVFSSRY